MTLPALLHTASFFTLALAFSCNVEAAEPSSDQAPSSSSASVPPAEPAPLPPVTPKKLRLPQEVNLNLFRNPSIGLEYRLGAFAVHAGAYPTVISQNAAGENETSWFLRAGLSVFFLGHSFYHQRKSEFYASASYMRGLNLGHENGAMFDVGYRWMVWRGLNVRFGAAVLLEPGEEVHVNPTPGIGWSETF